MLFKILLIATVAFAYALAEAPLQQHRQRSGPYPPSGWRPRKPFNLPGEYLPPTSNEFESQQQPQPAAGRPHDFEVSKQRVDFIGESQGSSAGFVPAAPNQPQSTYLPADAQDEVDFPRDQRLPVEGRYPVFNRDRTQFQARPHGNILNQQRKPVRQRPQGNNQPHQKYQPAEQQPQSFQPQQQQTQSFQPQRPQTQSFQPQQQQQPQSFQPQQPQTQTFQPQRPQTQSFQPQQQPQSFQPQQPQTQTFQPQQQPQSFQPQPQQFFPDQPKPAQQYGAPFTANNANPEPRNTQSVNNDFSADNDDQKDDSKSFENDNYDDSQQQQQEQPDDTDNNEDYRSNVPPSKSTKGQYYIVGPDNSIQRVMFTTTQDVEENGRSGNGFTAQLKYSPAGEVKDPIYRYNNRGQLVRVVKK